MSPVQWKMPEARSVANTQHVHRSVGKPNVHEAIEDLWIPLDLSGGRIVPAEACIASAPCVNRVVILSQVNNPIIDRRSVFRRIRIKAVLPEQAPIACLDCICYTVGLIKVGIYDVVVNDGSGCQV